MARPNYIRGGRPANDFRSEPLAPDGDITLGDQLIWVEGSLTVSQTDAAMLELTGRLDDFLKRLTVGRRDEYDQPVHKEGLFLVRKRVSADALGNYPRVTTDRRVQPRRLSSSEFVRMIAEHPGRTIPELAVDLYPNGQGDPRQREPSLRAQLWRLTIRGSVRWELDETGRRPEKRYYAMTHVPTKSNQKHQLIDVVLRHVLGTQTKNVENAVRAVVELIEHNAGRVDDLWRDPRGMLSTPLQYEPAFDGDPGPAF